MKILTTIKKLIQASLYLYIIVTITNSFQTCYKFENYPNLYLYILIHLRHLQFCNLVYCLGKKKIHRFSIPYPPFLRFCRICTFLILKKYSLCNDSEVKKILFELEIQIPPYHPTD